MSAGLLKRSNLLLSLVLGFASWLVLVPVWTHSAQGGLIDRAISTFFAPASWLAQRIGGLLFPDYLVPQSTGWYLVPLFVTVGEIAILSFTWYLGIRMKRAAETEQIPSVPSSVSNDRESDQGEEVNLDAEYEPVYLPPAKTYFTTVGPTIDYEQFKLRTWREFRKHTGRWPLFSVVFHYSTLAGMLAATLTFFWMKDRRDWVDEHSLLIGAFGIVFFCRVNGDRTEDYVEA